MDFISRTTHLMGATITISILPTFTEPQLTDRSTNSDVAYAEHLLNKVFELLQVYNLRFSANDMDSELMQINLAAGKQPIVVNQELFELIEIGKAHSLQPKSHLNIALGPLVQTWRIGFSDARIPNQTELEQALLLTDPADIKLDASNCTVFLAKRGMKLDLGCLAKGYIADKLADYLENQKVTSAIINLGGTIRTIGTNELTNRFWRIGIQNPLKPRGTNLAVLPIQNQSVVTSGVYERKLQVNGKSYHHILDRETGYPTQTQVTSLTIVSDTSLDGEIWTTRLFGEKPRTILEYVEKESGIDAFIVTGDNRAYHSSGIAPELIF